MTGPLINTDVPMAVGARCGEFYHTGLVDEVNITRVCVCVRVCTGACVNSTDKIRT